MIRKHGPCRGFRLLKIGRLQLELWIAPGNEYKINEHTHNSQHIELMYLFGSVSFFRRGLNGSIETADAKWPFKCYTIKPGVSHWFVSHGLWPCIFLNIELWNKGCKPTSASEDLQYVTR